MINYFVLDSPSSEDVEKVKSWGVSMTVTSKLEVITGSVLLT